MDNFGVTESIIYEKLWDKTDRADSGYESNNMYNGNYESVPTIEELDKLLASQTNTHYVFPNSVIVNGQTGIKSRLKVFLKKIIRRLVLWLIEPVCQRQSENNMASVMFDRNLLNYVVNQKNEVSMMVSEVSKISKDMDILRENAKDVFRIADKRYWSYENGSQSGEDQILAYFMMVIGLNIKDEFYLDLGANHAKELSNTWLFYKGGMRGVLVEANPKLIPELKFYRNEDIILNKCVSDKTGEKIKFYIMSGDGLSCADKESAEDAMRIDPELRIDEVIEVETITVNDILSKYFVKGPAILNVDVEGMEEDILSQYDYENYAPLCIVVERIDYSLFVASEKRKDRIEDIMRENGYFEYAFTGINSIYVNKARLKEYKGENSI